MRYKVFPLEKILSVSAEEYCKSNGKSLKEYKMIGVHLVGKNVKELSEHIPFIAPNAEVIVNYQFMFSNYLKINDYYQLIIATGTALVPKKKNKR